MPRHRRIIPQELGLALPALSAGHRPRGSYFLEENFLDEGRLFVELGREEAGPTGVRIRPAIDGLGALQ